QKEQKEETENNDEKDKELDNMMREIEELQRKAIIRNEEKRTQHIQSNRLDTPENLKRQFDLFIKRSSIDDDYLILKDEAPIVLHYLIVFISFLMFSFPFSYFLFEVPFSYT